LLDTGAVGRHPVSARLLRLVHGEVGELQRFHGPQAVEGGDSHAGGDVDAAVPEHRHLPAHRLHDAVGHDLRLTGIRLGEEHGELVPPHARQDVGLPFAMAQGTGNGAEEVVARLVAEGVVDVLEVVQIDHEDGAIGSVPQHALGFAGDLLLEPLPVEETGEEVVVDEVLQTCRQPLALGDVLDLGEEVGRSAAPCRAPGRR
jgi:hypothetical protein